MEVGICLKLGSIYVQNGSKSKLKLNWDVDVLQAFLSQIK
jgi:hypothetical protein